MSGTIEYFQSDRDELYYDRLRGKNGEILSISEGLTSIQNVLKNVNAQCEIFSGTEKQLIELKKSIKCQDLHINVQLTTKTYMS